MTHQQTGGEFTNSIAVTRKRRTGYRRRDARTLSARMHRATGGEDVARLPGPRSVDDGGFDRIETCRQSRVKACWWPGLEDGKWRGRQYAHILPESHRFENLGPATRDAVRAYLESNSISLHPDFANLKSSQACCLNLLFPLRRELDGARVALRPLLPDVEAVHRIEFEYTGPKGATCWLGEPPGGKRGQNRTSADAAIWWVDAGRRSRLTLVEWKYTERQFGTCGGLASDGNRRKDRCRTRADAATPSWNCYLVSGDSSRTKRRYWDRLEVAGIHLARYEGAPCPFAGPFYQLMRLHLLAVYCAEKGVAQKVDVAAVHFGGNSSVDTAPPELRRLAGTVSAAWKGMLSDPDDFRVCHAEALAAGIRETGAFPDVADYLAERYGV